MVYFVSMCVFCSCSVMCSIIFLRMFPSLAIFVFPFTSASAILCSVLAIVSVMVLVNFLFVSHCTYLLCVLLYDTCSGLCNMVFYVFA